MLFKDKGLHQASVSDYRLITQNLIGMYVNISLGRPDSSGQLVQWLTSLKCVAFLSFDTT